MVDIKLNILYAIIMKRFLLLLIWIVNANLFAQNVFRVDDIIYNFSQDISHYNLKELSLKEFEETYRNAFPYKLNFFENYREIETYENQQFALAIYKFNWYEVKTFIFTRENTFINDYIFIGNSYENIKAELNGPIQEYGYNQYFRVMHLGTQYRGFHYYISEMTLFFSEDRILCEIQVNFIKKSPSDENFLSIVFNEWRAPRSSFGIVRLQLKNDYSFILSYEQNSFEGTFLIIFNDEIPVFKILTFNGVIYNQEYQIYKIGTNMYCIYIDSFFYIYPFPQYLE
jgi:hypothetical protein